jgi:hypothetical protein
MKHISFSCFLAAAGSAFAHVIGNHHPFADGSNNHHGLLPSHDIRQLQEAGAAGDFDRFNELFQGATITIPNDFEVSETVAFITLTLWVDNILCYNMSVGNIALNHTKTNTDIDVTVDITDLDLICDIDYRYKYGLLSGDGVAQIFTDNNSAATTLRFTSDDYASLPPSTNSVEQCTTNINIVDIMFHGDAASDIVELFEKSIRDLVAREIEAVACSELGSLGTSFVQDMLQIADKTLQGYQSLNMEPELLDPLYLEQTADLPEDLAPLNLQDMDSIAGGLFNQALQAVDGLFGNVVPDPEGPTDTDLGINIMLRSTLLDADRALVLDVDQFGMDAVVFQGHDQLTQSAITINQVKVLGLDTMTKFNSLDPIGIHTLQNQLTWDFLTLEFDVTVDIKPSTLEDAVLQDATSSGISERILIDFGVRNVDVVASLFLVIDQDALGGMELGSLLSLENLLPCFMSIIHDVQLSGLSVDPQNLDVPTLTGFVSPGLDRVITGAVEAAFDMYSGALAETIPNIFQVTVRDFVNDQVISPFLEGNEASCPQNAIEVEGFVEFPELFDSGSAVYGNISSMLRNLLDTELLQLDPDSGKPKINKVLIDPVTSSQSGTQGTISFDGNLFETGTSISVGGLNADIQLRASDAKIENINTVMMPLQLLDTIPSEPYHLNNTATVGSSEQPLRFSTRFLFSVTGADENQIKNELDINLDLDTASVYLLAMLKVANSRLLGFPLEDVFDMNCWLATIPAPLLDSRGIRLADSEVTAALEDIGASVSRFTLNVSCVECSSPGMTDLAELLSTQEAQDGITETTNTILHYAADFLSGDFVQVQIDRLLAEAARKCPHSPDFDPTATAVQYEPFAAPQNESDVTYLMLLGGVTLGLIAAVATVVLAVRCIVKRRHRWWLTQIPEEQIHTLQRQQQKEAAMEAELNGNSKSMFRSTEVPFIVRWGMPLIILGNIGLFISGHISLGATVNIEARIAGETIRVEEFFEFSMAKSTIDIWNAGGRELAILILIFSGIWPYTKQLITLGLWFMPPRWVSISKRGSILLWLDWLAKWSIIDIFVLVISIAAFRVSVQSPDVAFLPEGFYSLDLMVVPLWGLYANMLAQLVSQVSSHFILHYQRRIYSNARDAFKKAHHLQSVRSASFVRTSSLVSHASYDGKRLLKKHQFGRPHRGESQKLVVRGWVSYAIIFLGFCLVFLVVVGCVMPSFALDIHGLVGVAVESGQKFEDATTYHSVFTVVQLLMEEARFLDTASDYLGLGTLSVLFVLTVLVVPVLQSLALMRQWFSPLTLAERSRMSIAIEVLQAWQYAEVYLIAIFVASWQLGPVSEFMINSYCESLGDFFAEMVYFDFLKEEDAQCFGVQSSIEEGAFILAAGTVFLALLNTFMTKAVTQYLREKAELVKQIEDEISTDKMDEEQAAQGNAASSAESRIHPVPVLFTDTFRWLLRGDTEQNSSRAFEAQFDVPTLASKEVCAIEDDKALESLPSTPSAASRDEGMLPVSSDHDDDARGLTTVSLDEESRSIPEDKEYTLPMGNGDRKSTRQNVGRLLSLSINNRPDKGDDSAP